MSAGGFFSAYRRSFRGGNRPALDYRLAAWGCLLWTACLVGDLKPASSATCPASPLPTRQDGTRSDSIDRGIAYLWSQQATDGSWKSEYYGNLKQGAGITSLVLFSLSHAPLASIKDHQAKVRRAFEFLKKGIRLHGYVGNESGPDYANYATALTLLAARKFEEKWSWKFLTATEKQKLVNFLVDSQLDDTHGLAPDKDDHGGWDLSGWIQEPRESPGTNISITSFVLWAIEMESGKSVESARQKARRWLQRVVNPDHGFHFHPQKDHPGNKAEWTDRAARQPKSYGTATIDGIRAMRALGFPKKKITLSANWLEKQTHPKLGVRFVPGFEYPADGGFGQEPANRQQQDAARDSSWGQGLLYYYLAGLALEKENLPPSLRKMSERQIPEYLAKHQRKDGRWENSSLRMREDDPLIATSFAVIALAAWSNQK